MVHTFADAMLCFNRFSMADTPIWWSELVNNGLKMQAGLVSSAYLRGQNLLHLPYLLGAGRVSKAQVVPIAWCTILGPKGWYFAKGHGGG